MSKNSKLQNIIESIVIESLEKWMDECDCEDDDKDLDEADVKSGQRSFGGGQAEKKSKKVDASRKKSKTVNEAWPGQQPEEPVFEMVRKYIQNRSRAGSSPESAADDLIAVIQDTVKEEMENWDESNFDYNS
jgi:hypothetical protein